MESTSESDAAFYSFSCVMLSLYIVPAAVFTLYRVVKTPKQTRTTAFAVNVAALGVALALAYYCLQQLQSVDTSGVFDPYEILHISDTASIREIKKAYRTLGRELHPDKNLATPRAAAARFARVTKAYEALTDAAGIANYRKFGHPDGRQSMLMDFAFLSSFSNDADSGSASLFVVAYFLVVFGGLAYVASALHAKSSRRDRTQLSNATKALVTDALQNNMSVHDIVELLLSTSEMTTFGDDATNRLEAQQRTPAHNKLIKKMDAARALPSEVLNRIKKHPDPVARENMLALYQFLRRNKLQGVMKPTWLDARLHKVLFELPFLIDIFATLVTEHSIQRGFTATTLVRTLSLLPSLAQGALAADADALRDQRARLTTDTSLPQLRFASATLRVLDEPNIQPNDYVTATLTLVRDHVAVNAMAPLAATFYDAIDPKSPFRREQLWFIVQDKATSRLFAAWKCADLAQTVTQTIGFAGPGVAGTYDVEIRAIAIANLDAEARVVVPMAVDVPRK